MLSNQTSINGTVQPSPVPLKAMQSTYCLLILMSDPDSPPDTVTQINVTATPVSHNADVKHLQVFSLTVAVDRRLPSKTEDLEKDSKLATWHIVIIAMVAVLCSLLLVLLVILLVYRMKHSSWIPRKPAENNSNRGPTTSQLQLNKFEEVIYLQS